MDFLLGRYRTLIAENEQQEINRDRIAVFDRHYLDDMIFANLKSIREDMSGFQYSMYKNTNLELAKNIQPEDQPDFFILLKIPFDQVLERIKLRGRDAEQAVDEEY